MRKLGLPYLRNLPPKKLKMVMAKELYQAHTQDSEKKGFRFSWPCIVFKATTIFTGYQ